MDFRYSTNINVQLIVALLKAHGIRKVIASPGTTNLELIVSFQSDDYFEMYSCVDERSAAYMACGLAAESGEPVVITCTEATASRNYFSGLTEAYHRKLPVIAITGLHDYSYVGKLEPQVIDRSVAPLDTMKLKVNLPIIKDERDYQESMLLINKAILETTHRGGGPVHINMPWGGGNFDFSVKELPKVRIIKRFCAFDNPLPNITGDKIAILCGSHAEWTDEQVEAIEFFCEKFNAVVFCDHTSKYYGKYAVHGAILAMQQSYISVLHDIDLLIHIGEETGDDKTAKILGDAKVVWRVSEDGEIRDTFGKLTCVYEMPEQIFFSKYTNSYCGSANTSYYSKCREVLNKIADVQVELPFSNMYAASKIVKELPRNSVIHFGVSDTIRAWSLFELPKSVRSSCNAGCRGIDGCVSALIGASFHDPNKLYFGIVGDLTFFYDLNSLGNRSIKNNIRILVANNDGGNIFRHHGHASQKWLGYEKSNLFIAAGGHFGAKSETLLKGYAESLGFEYLSARSKEEFDLVYKRFINNNMTDRPMVFEIFTEGPNDSKAFDIMSCIMVDAKGQAKTMLKSVIGEQGTTFLKKIIKK